MDITSTSHIYFNRNKNSYIEVLQNEHLLTIDEVLHSIKVQLF